MTEPMDPYETSNEADDVFLSPPTERDEVDLADPPKWPKVVGIMSIVLGSLGVLCTGGGTAMTGLSARLMQSSGIEGPLPPAITNPPMIIYVSGALSVLWSIYLVVTGVITANRNPVGRIMHLVYAVVAIGIITLSLKFGLDQQAELAAWIKDHPDSAFANSPGQGGTIGVISVFITSFVRYLWPTFCLILFGLIKTKPKQMTGGGLAPAA